MTDSLVTRIERAATRGRGVTFLDTDDAARVAWEQIHADARRLAAALQARGAGPGERVGVLGATSRSVLTSIEATWLSGAAVVVLPLPTRLASPDEFRAQTRGRITLADVALTVSDPDLVAAAEAEPGDDTVLTFAALERAARALGDADYERPPDDPEATAILQFTSGSTADPKGVVIPQRCVMDNLDAAAERAPMDADEDVVVSWVPLYHDMGLVYNAANAMTNGAEFALAPPTRFVSSPGAWMTWMSELRGSWTIGPNFGLAIAARLLGRGGGLDLSRCRRFGSGSEPVQADVMDALAAAGAAHHLDPASLYAGYGMAEATVAISIPHAGSGFAVDIVDGETLEHDLRAEPVAPDRARARRLARCGPPLRGMELRVTDPESGATLEERQLGEVEIRGPSVVPGYFRRPDATEAAFRDGGWLRTGDLGYLAEGDVVIGGRLKDVIMVGGRNLFPEDLERAAQAVEGVRPGNVIAFGVDGGRRGEGVVIVAELKDGAPGEVRDGIARAVRHAVGLRPSEVVLLPTGALPKTSSGKLRRSVCRARYQAAEMESL
jgi:fatty-acyl-CoA synthase